MTKKKEEKKASEEGNIPFFTRIGRVSQYTLPLSVWAWHNVTRLELIMLLVRLVLTIGKSTPSPPSPLKPSGEPTIKWKMPPRHWIKVNFDGSVRDNMTATSFVIWDWNGNVRLAGAKNLGHVSINVAECLALRDGLAHAINNGWRKVLIEGDSKFVIDCINNKVSVPWSIRLLVQDIRLLSSYCEEISFHHVFREANFTADS